MRKIVALFLSILFVFSFSACKDKSKYDDTVEVAVNTEYSLSDLFKGGDSLYNVKIKNPSGEEIKINSPKMVFNTLGSYEFLHVNGEITELKVLDGVAPAIRFDFMGFNPKIGEQTVLPILAVDNYDTNVEYAVCQGETDVKNGFTPAINGVVLSVKASDSSGNSSEIRVEMQTLGKVIRIDESVFTNLDQNKTYTFTYRITEYTNESAQTYLGNSFALEKDKKYSVTALAVCDAETIEVVTYCIPLYN